MKHLPDPRLPREIQFFSRYDRGYSLIEIIISLFILIVIFTSIQAGYRRFILVKALETTKTQIMSDIRLAQEYALAGKKISTCTNLTGYYFSINSSSYSIIADCDTDRTIKTVPLSDLATGITSSTTVSVLFRGLGGGTSIAAGSEQIITLNQQTTGYSRRIIISSGGSVK